MGVGNEKREHADEGGRIEEGGGSNDITRSLYKVYDTIEDMRRDKEIYKAVRAAIRATHQADGVTVEHIIGETAAQRRDGRLRYLVVAEEKAENDKGVGCAGEDQGTRLRSQNMSGVGLRVGSGQRHGKRGGGQERAGPVARGSAGGKTMDRACLVVQAGERARE